MTGLANAFSKALDGRYPNPEEAAELYRLRALEVKGLQSQPVISLADVQTLDRLGRFHIADESFDKCDVAAQNALRNDPHHSVRSAVATFRPTNASNNGSAHPA